MRRAATHYYCFFCNRFGLSGDRLIQDRAHFLPLTGKLLAVGAISEPHVSCVRSLRLKPPLCITSDLCGCVCHGLCAKRTRGFVLFDLPGLSACARPPRPLLGSATCCLVHTFVSRPILVLLCSGLQVRSILKVLRAEGEEVSAVVTGLRQQLEMQASRCKRLETESSSRTRPRERVSAAEQLLQCERTATRRACFDRWRAVAQSCQSRLAWVFSPVRSQTGFAAIFASCSGPCAPASLVQREEVCVRRPLPP